MDCRGFRRVFSEYVDGVLDGPGMADASMHLSGCERCRRLECAYRSGLAVLRGLPAPTPSRDFGARVINRVRRPTEAPYPTGAPAFAGSLLALTIVGLFLLAPPGYQKPVPEPLPSDGASGAAGLSVQSGYPAADVITVRVVSDHYDLGVDPNPSFLSDDSFVTTRIRFDVPAVWTGR